MKISHKGGIAAGVIGLLLLAMNLAGAAETLANPTSLPQVDFATLITDACWIALSLFLIYVFVRSRQKSGLDAASAKPEVGSLEDAALLKTRRDWILAFVLLFLFIGSVNVWVLNDYAAGPTLINTEVIFDLVANLFFLYVAIQLLRDSRQVQLPLLYGVVVYTIVEAALDLFRGENWVNPATGIVIAVYFVLSLWLPANRKNFRLTQFILLPAIAFIVLALGSLGNSETNAISKSETRLEAQYATLNQNIGSDYVAFVQNPSTSVSTLPLMESAIGQRQQVAAQIHANIDSLKSIYDKQLPSINKLQQLDYLEKFRAVLAAQQEQVDTLSELIEFAKGVDLSRPTSAQSEKLASYEQQIESEEAVITDANVTLNQP